VLPLVVVAVVLYVRGDKLPLRGTVEERRLPRSPRPVRVLPYTVAGVAVAVVAASIFTGAWALAFTTTVISAILMLSYVVLTGYVGQISLAQLSLAGVAGFIMTRLMSNGTVDKLHPFAISGPGLPMILAFPLAVIVAVIVGVVIGIPALRIRGVQLAVVTIAAALTLQSFYFENPSLTELRSGSGAAVPKPTLFGVDLGVASSRGLADRFSFSVFAIVVLAICAVFVCNLRRGSAGRRMLAVRANERAAAAAGINVAGTKILAFAIASGLAGVSGVLFAYQQQNISSANWTFFLGIGFLAFVYLGGITSVNGALVGAALAAGGIIAFFGKYHFHGLDKYTDILGGIGLIVTAVANPNGIAPTLQPAMRAFGNAFVHWRAKEWVRAARRLVPAIALGAFLGWLIWTRRPGYNAWMIVVAIGLTLFVRANALEIYRARKKVIRPAVVSLGGTHDAPLTGGPGNGAVATKSSSLLH
jgi:branched-chain amino acid transport system permease protein